MIAEPGILSTSPWNSDLLLRDLHSDLYKSSLSVSDVLDVGFPFMDVDNDSWTRSSRRETECAFESSCSQSSASSECSEELNVDEVWSFGGAANSCHSTANSSVFPLTDHDYLNTSFGMLDDTSLAAVCPGDCDFDWVAGEDLVVSSADSVFDEEDSSCADMLCTVACSSVLKPRRNRPVNDAVTDNKLWSKMSLEEQIEAVDALTYIVSNQMGLREQLDIIRVIEPSAVISPTDKEFVIDLSCLNDDKLCKVREYIRRIQSSQDARPKRSDAQSASEALPSSLPTSGRCSSSSTKSDTNQSVTKGKHTKRENKEKLPPQKVVRQRQKKEYKQQMKERRSGLFKREEVLSLSACEIIEEDDVDILG